MLVSVFISLEKGIEVLLSIQHEPRMFEFKLIGKEDHWRADGADTFICTEPPEMYSCSVKGSVKASCRHHPLGGCGPGA